jgi:hypothetical protein
MSRQGPDAHKQFWRLAVAPGCRAVRLESWKVIPIFGVVFCEVVKACCKN